MRLTKNCGVMISSMFPQAQHYISHEKHAHTSFGCSISPAITVLPGEYVHVKTVDCFSNLITPNNPYPTLERSQLNPVTGPIYVAGAMPGDLLSVTLHDIRPSGLGVACCGTHGGQLCHTISQKSTKFFDLSEDRTTVTMVDDINTLYKEKDQSRKRVAAISFPASPMLGVVGVAPVGKESISTMPAGIHGGNLDNKLNGIGATIHIPINHPGALLSIGDMHASQGDGEIAGTGVEIGGDVLLSCQILKRNAVYSGSSGTTCRPSDTNDNQICKFPITETATHWITHGVAVEDIPKITNLACEEAAKLLVGQWGFTPDEAFIFLSVKGDLGLCQSCHPDQGTQIARMVVPKINACPKPFRCLL